MCVIKSKAFLLCFANELQNELKNEDAKAGMWSDFFMEISLRYRTEERHIC